MFALNTGAASNTRIGEHPAPVDACSQEHASTGIPLSEGGNTMRLLHKPFSILLLFLLVLTTLTAGAAARPSHAQSQTMPDELMSAFLVASSQPFAASPDGYLAHSGGLEVTLGASGLHAKGDGIAWSLALRGWGRGEQIVPASEAEILQTDRRVEYRRGALTEWYRDTALGVEQCFSLSQAPRGVGPLVMLLDVSTDLAGMLDTDGRGLSFASPEGRTLRYAHLRAWDANNVPLDARLLFSPGQIMLQVNDQGAAYPLTIDPLIYPEQKVIAGGDPSDGLGTSVALSSDTALVGAVRDSQNRGVVYVFTRNGTTWSQQARLAASDGALDDWFGASVALSGDTALVGAAGTDVGANSDQGSAYVFTRSGTMWTQQAKLIAVDGQTFDYFGASVALSSDTALVGAYGDDFGLNSDQGSAYVFVRSGSAWTQQAKLIAVDGQTFDYFGFSVALSGDTALIGAEQDDVGLNPDQGSAYVFVRSGSSWGLQQKLTASSDGAVGDLFGASVALSGDTALMGAPGVDFGEYFHQGAAYVFTRSGTTWSQQAKLTTDDKVGEDYFGSAVALSADTAVAGAYNDHEGQGSAYVFVRSGNAWTQQAKLLTSGVVMDAKFGSSVAVWGDTALMAAPGDNVGANAGQGPVYVYVRSGTTWSLQQRLNAATGEAGDNFGMSVALSGNTAIVGAPGDDLFGNVDQGSAYVFIHNGRTWTQDAKLYDPNGRAYDHFGASVALSGDTALVGAYGDDVEVYSDQGSASVFVRSYNTWGWQANLIASDGAAGDHFGISVALSGDKALVGAALDDVDGKADQGSVYVFTYSVSDWMWIQQAKLTAADGAASDLFGYSVALSGDSALVGSYGDNGGQGSAYVFTRNGTTWSQQAQLAASDGAADDQFGHSVALWGDRALVGAYMHDFGANNNQGSAYVFTRSGASWSQQAELTASDGAASDLFGISVVLSGDTALVGATGGDGGATSYQGSAYVFTQSGTAWMQQAKLTASDGAAADYFGASVALSDSTFLVGAYADDVGTNTDQGSAYFYNRLINSLNLPLLRRSAP